MVLFLLQWVPTAEAEYPLVQTLYLQLFSTFVFRCVSLQSVRTERLYIYIAWEVSAFWCVRGSAVSVWSFQISYTNINVTNPFYLTPLGGYSSVQKVRWRRSANGSTGCLYGSGHQVRKCFFFLPELQLMLLMGQWRDGVHPIKALRRSWHRTSTCL